MFISRRNEEQKTPSLEESIRTKAMADALFAQVDSDIGLEITEVFASTLRRLKPTTTKELIEELVLDDSVGNKRLAVGGTRAFSPERGDLEFGEWKMKILDQAVTGATDTDLELEVLGEVGMLHHLGCITDERFKETCERLPDPPEEWDWDS